MFKKLINLCSVCCWFGENQEEVGEFKKDGLLWYHDIGKHGYGEYSMAVIQANQVLEDQCQIESGNFGTFVGVYDGHGGPDVARYVCDNLFRHFQANAAESHGIVTPETIKKAFLETEKGFTSLVSQLWNSRPDLATVGSCCLVGVVYQQTLFVANAGDSRVVLGRKVGNTGGITAIQLSKEHNANLDNIRRELRDMHPLDPQIVVLKHGVWRVKGIIQVSRSIGDVYMKHARYNKEPIAAKFRLPERTMMPIMSASPSTLSHPIQPSDSFLIFASDGLWEHLSNDEAVEIVHNSPRAATKVSNKVKSKMKNGENSTVQDVASGDSQYSENDANGPDHKEDGYSSGASTPRGDIPQSPFTVKPSTDSGDESENKPGIHKILSSKAEAWMGKKGITWPWKGSEREGGSTSSDSKVGRFGLHWLNNDQEHESGQQTSSSKVDNQAWDNTNRNEASGSWSSSFNVNSTSSASSCGSTNSSAINKADMDTDSLDYEILWEDLIIGEQIGQGSCGTVYHALWYGSDVAIKVFSRQEYSDDVILSFRQEVSLMKRLRHPNILLFMGAVTSPQRLCIVTEFLPRGSLFRLLQRNTTKLDWRRRVHMAMDIARGMNYLHHCHPPIIHRDLKSSNLLVDKNWNVKVGDFGLSRIKHETYLTTKTGKGTPQWMAPEVLRNEQADEKSDIYSFGVVLWELTTEKIPWDTLNSMQVIGAVGFMNQRLDIPQDVDPQWASLIESCWCSEPQSRPTFQEILDKLKELQKKFTIQLQASRSATAATATATSGENNSQKES